MDTISEGAELWLELLENDFTCELGNHAIQSEHVKYASATEARKAMLRLAYLKGREDATATPPDEDFETMAARITGKP